MALPASFRLTDGRTVTAAFLLNSADGGGIVTPPSSFRLPDGRTVTGIVLVDEDGEILGAPTSAADIDDAFELAQSNTIESLPVSVATAAFTPTANQVYLKRFSVIGDVLITNLIYYVRVASGNVDLGIYENVSGTLTRIAHTGSTAVAGTNAAQSIALLAPVTLVPGGDYFFALEADTGVTLSIDRSVVIAAVGGIANRAVSIAAGAFPLPTTITLASTAGSSTIVAMVGT